ncbi:MAG: regulatory iron-sulfur-containing complex subunit RicT [Candidatus Eremiobacteraeota bacterium]|nr:regulatory iron-sulfur-containing complex subunit RicT [Candidatus Eremiobacteraeota bacterium]
MPDVVGVSFKRAGKIYHFEKGSIELSIGDYVIVETVRGREMGRVSVASREVEGDSSGTALKSIIRKATEEDFDLYYENRFKAAEALKICAEKVKAHKLAMKLIDVEYTHEGSKVIFYFSAEGRIDFRNLVRDLAAVFKKRIELHQIGVRDEAKLIGGLGPCGRPICCATFMTEFDPVSIKMAKEQNLSLNPERISGTCGRLMCCLKHEHCFYHETLKELPEIGTTIEFPEGPGMVVDLSVPKRSVIMEFANNVRTEVPQAELPPYRPARAERGENRGRQGKRNGEKPPAPPSQKPDEKPQEKPPKEPQEKPPEGPQEKPQEKPPGEPENSPPQGSERGE